MTAVAGVSVVTPDRATGPCRQRWRASPRRSPMPWTHRCCRRRRRPTPRPPLPATSGVAAAVAAPSAAPTVRARRRGRCCRRPPPTSARRRPPDPPRAHRRGVALGRVHRHARPDARLRAQAALGGVVPGAQAVPEELRGAAGAPHLGAAFRPLVVLLAAGRGSARKDRAKGGRWRGFLRCWSSVGGGAVLFDGIPLGPDPSWVLAQPWVLPLLRDAVWRSPLGLVAARVWPLADKLAADSLRTWSRRSQRAGRWRRRARASTFASAAATLHALLSRERDAAVLVAI